MSWWTSEVAYNIVGACGALFILFGFYRVSIGRWTSKSLWYELDNLVGPLLLIAYQLHHRTYIGAVLNIVWAWVAFRGLRPFAERYKFGRKHVKKRRRAR